MSKVWFITGAGRGMGVDTAKTPDWPVYDHNYFQKSFCTGMTLKHQLLNQSRPTPANASPKRNPRPPMLISNQGVGLSSGRSQDADKQFQ
jgi:hypothetical protein